LEEKNKVAIFVDYENFFYSMYNKFHTQPNPMEFIRTARMYGQIVIARAYGDFEKNPYIKNELPKLRAASFEVIHTRTELVGGKEKSYTDFKILEDLFVFREENREVNTIVLVTGDGHFSNAVARIKIRDGRRVIIIGVKGSISRELQMSAGRNNVVEVSGISYEVDLEELKQFVHLQESRYKYLTFTKTAQAYLGSLEVPEEYRNCFYSKIIAAMKKLINDGYLEQERVMRNDLPINVIRVAGQKSLEVYG